MKIDCFSCKDGMNKLSKKLFEHSEPWRFTQCRWTKGIHIMAIRVVKFTGNQGNTGCGVFKGGINT